MDLAGFHKNGFQIIRNFLPQELVCQVQKLLVSASSQITKKLQYLLNEYDPLKLPQKIAHFKASAAFNEVDPDIKNMITGHFDKQTRLNPLLIELISTPAVQAMVSEIFKDEVPYLHMPPMARFVMPHNLSAAAPPHQDVTYNQHLDDFFILWVPLCKITEKRGGVKFYKETNHKTMIALPRANDFWLPPIDITDKEEVHYTMDLGDVLIFNKWVVHASGINISDEPRLSIDYRFFTGKSEKHYLDFQTMQVIEPASVAV